jgi:glycosyltransferase involved in cell wall biosynthesis
VEPQDTWSPSDIVECRRQLGVPADRTIVAIAGQIAEVKGIWDFVDAASALAGRGSEAFFVVLGDDLKNGGKTRRAMEERVIALGLSERFKFLGFRNDAPRVVQAFDIIAVPSHVEPLGNATLEAMAAGRPVVGSRVGGIPEMVVDGETGVLVPPGSPSALAGAIDRLVHERKLRSRMSVAARTRAHDSFGLDVHGRRLQAHYDRLCSPKLATTEARDQLA